jgi:2-polyprenyl-6-methoxyphenol hydroxylase-like FAD-dependent oxidoreductase
MVFSRKKPDVLVVGAGPVGLFTALVLCDRGVNVQIVDRAQHTGTRSYALALHADSLRLLDDFGLLSDVLQLAHRVRSIGLYDCERRRARMSLSDLPIDHSFLAVVGQNGLEHILEQALAKRGVKVEWSHAVQNLLPADDGVDVTLDKLSLDTLGYSVQHSEWVVAKTSHRAYRYVIGADGNASVVRRRLGIPFPKIGERTEFAVFDFSTDAGLGDELRLIFGDDSVNVAWPMSETRCRWSFQRTLQDRVNTQRESKDQSLVQIPSREFPELTEDWLRQMLAQRAPWFTGDIKTVHWRMEVRFENRLVERLGTGRSWLVGDAAHLTGPAGIQSMNVGLREAIDLAGAVHAALADEKSGGLAQYDERCRAEWRGLLGLDPLFAAGKSADPWVAAQLGRLVPCVPASGIDLARLVEQVGITRAGA